MNGRRQLPAQPPAGSRLCRALLRKATRAAVAAAGGREFIRDQIAVAVVREDVLHKAEDLKGAAAVRLERALWETLLRLAVEAEGPSHV